MSSVLWNNKDLIPPPNFTYKDHSVDVGSLKMVCEKALSALNNLKNLHIEAAMLSRFLYTVKTKFRTDKGVNYLEKVNRGLLNYLSLNLTGIFDNFNQCVPLASDLDRYVPTRQMLHYLLVRTQSFSQLWCKIIKCCEAAALYLRARIGIGHIWGAALIGFGIVSRIWTIGKYLVQSACEWYSQLLPYLKELKLTGMPWLPDDYSLPSNLVLWLDEPWLKKERERIKFEEEKSNVIFDKVFSVSNNEDCDIQVLDDNDAESNSSNRSVEVGKLETKIDQNSFIGAHKDEDIGESIPREALCFPNDLQNNSLCFEMDKHSLLHRGLHHCVTETKNSANGSSIKIENNMDIHSCSSSKKSTSSETLTFTSLQDCSSINKSQVSIREKCLPKTKIRKFKNHSDLILFIENEKQLREVNKKKCLTQNLDLLQWHMLQKLVSTFLSKLHKLSSKGDSSKYELCLKKAWKAINQTIS